MNMSVCDYDGRVGTSFALTQLQSTKKKDITEDSQDSLTHYKFINKKANFAEKIEADTLELVKNFGIREYFEPYKDAASKNGYGGKRFSWSAALGLDLLNQ